MGYKRAEWHSGLTYRQTCHECKTNVEYTDYALDFRPWYADGFVYCPRCKTPLRHGEHFAINAPYAPVVSTPSASAGPSPAPSLSPSPMEAPGGAGAVAKFCTGCGRPFNPSDRFCSHCGTKR